MQEKKSKVRAISSSLTSGSSTPSSIGGASVQPSYPRHGGKGPIVDATDKSPGEKDKTGLKHPTESALSPAVRDQNIPTVSSPAKRPADLAISPGAKCPSDVISPCSSSSSSAKKRRKEKDPSSKDKEHSKDHSSGKKSSHSHKEKSRSKESSKSKPHKSSKRDRKSTDSKPSQVDGDRKSSSKSKPVATAARDESPPVAAVAPKLKVELLAFDEELSTGEQSEFDPFEDIAAGAPLKPPVEKLRGRGLSALIAQLGEGDCDSDSHDELLSPLSATSPPVLFPEFQSSDHEDNIPVGRLPHQVTDSAPDLKSEPDWLSPLGGATTPVSPLKGSPCSDKAVIHKSPSDKYSVKKVSPLRLFPSSQEKPGKSKHDRPKKSKSDKKPKENHSKDKENEESNSATPSRERKDVVTDQPDQSDRVSTPVRIATEPDPENDASLLPLNQIDRSNQHAPNGESLSTLLDLQERLMMMTDARLLQKIVSIIEETGNYKINETTFDFDLYCLDRTTVQKLLDFLLQAAG